MSSLLLDPCVKSQKANCRKYKCLVCSAAFLHRKNLYAHLIKDHEYNEGDAPIPRERSKYGICELCQMVFTDLKDHKQSVHGVAVEEKTNKWKLLCPVCGVLFSTEANMKKHQLRMHPKETQNDQVSVAGTQHKKYRSRIKCPQCQLGTLKTYKNLQNHLLWEHNISIQYEELHFDSFEEFEKWKAAYEDSHYVFYIKDCSPKLRNNADKQYLYYNCHRSYAYKPTKQRTKCQKYMGSNKIGDTCPSHIKVILAKNTCVVHFWKTHLGHTAEIQRCKLRKNIRTEIASKIEAGVPIQHILDETRASLVKDKVMQRVHLLTKKDIYNISRDFKVQFNGDRDADLGITEWVKRMHQLSESPVVYFKNVGNTDETTLLKDDFAIILIESSHIPQLEKFGNKLICIDQLQYDSSCEFNLYILMVVDNEVDLACAVAFCFSNRSDEAIFQLFFEKLKCRVGEIKTSIFVSDQNPATYKSWCSVMSEVPHHFWSKWHIAQDWALHIDILISQHQKQDWVDNMLKALQDARNKDSLESMLPNILDGFHKDPELVDFGDFFANHYLNFIELWGSCYRVNFKPKMDICLQSLHAVYEQLFSRLSKKKKFVNAVESVLKTTRENYFKHIIKLSAATQNATEIVTESECNTTTVVDKPSKDTTTCPLETNRHYKSKTISSDMIVTFKEDEEWIVFSLEPLRIEYVTKEKVKCINCGSRCSSCNICIHTFKCSCDDYKINFNMCVHIHACARMLNRSCKIDCVHSQVTIKHEDADVLRSCDSDTFEIMYTEENENKSQQSFLDEIKCKTNLILNLSEQIALCENDQLNILNKVDGIIDIFDKQKN